MSTTVKANGVKNVSNNSRTVPSRCFTPPFWTFYLLSLNKSNLCPIGVDLPNIQVFILPKTGIKLIWRKALCQTSLLYVWKSKMKKGIYHVKKLSCNSSALFPSIHPTYKSKITLNFCENIHDTCTL